MNKRGKSRFNSAMSSIHRTSNYALFGFLPPRSASVARTDNKYISYSVKDAKGRFAGGKKLSVVGVTVGGTLKWGISVKVGLEQMMIPLEVSGALTIRTHNFHRWSLGADGREIAWPNSSIELIYAVLLPHSSAVGTGAGASGNDGTVRRLYYLIDSDVMHLSADAKCLVNPLVRQV